MQTPHDSVVRRPDAGACPCVPCNWVRSSSFHAAHGRRHQEDATAVFGVTDGVEVGAIRNPAID
jgi:hypothetical protein